MVFFFLKIIIKKFPILKVVYNLSKVKKKKGRKPFKNDKNVLMYFLLGVRAIREFREIIRNNTDVCVAYFVERDLCFNFFKSWNGCLIKIHHNHVIQFEISKENKLSFLKKLTVFKANPKPHLIFIVFI